MITNTSTGIFLNSVCIFQTPMMKEMTSNRALGDDLEQSTGEIVPFRIALLCSVRDLIDPKDGHDLFLATLSM